MACGGCAKRRAAKKSAIDKNPVMGGYKFLTDVQIKARLEAYKKKYCSDCKKRYECDYSNYVSCKNIVQ